MHRCAKRIRFFLVVLFIKVLFVSALLMKSADAKKSIPRHKAVKEFNAYLIKKIEHKGIIISPHERENLERIGRIILTAYGKKLTKEQFSSVKRKLRDYLKIRFPNSYKKSPKQDNSIPFRLAKKAIKARLIDYLQQRMNVVDLEYQKALWQTVRGFVMYQLYEKSYFDERSGGLVVDNTDIASIFTNARKLLKSYQKQIPAQARTHLIASKDKPVTKNHKSKKKYRRHLVAHPQAKKLVTMIIKRSGVNTSEQKKLFDDIMGRINAQVVNNKIDHYLMKKLAHDEIKKHEAELAKRICLICSKPAQAPNRKIFSCEHTFHKTCLYKKFGTVEFLKSWRGVKKCPRCIKK